jgi:hypothetical protein
MMLLPALWIAVISSSNQKVEPEWLPKILARLRLP